MKLSPITIQRFNELNQTLFNSLHFDDRTMYLNGSYPKTLFSSDIDLYSYIPDTALPDLLKFIHRQITLFTPPVWFSSLRIGASKYTDKADALKALTKSYDVKDLYYHKYKAYWVKLNIYLFTGEYINEVSIVYDLTKPSMRPSTHQIKQMIQHDNQTLIEQGRLYKALKRKTRHTKAEKAILDNWKYGLLYTSISNLQPIEDTRIPLPLRKQVLQQIREDVQIRLGIGKTLRFTISNIPTLRQWLQHRLTANVRTKINP